MLSVAAAFEDCEVRQQSLQEMPRSASTSCWLTAAWRPWQEEELRSGSGSDGCGGAGGGTGGGNREIVK